MLFLVRLYAQINIFNTNMEITKTVELKNVVF